MRYHVTVRLNRVALFDQTQTVWGDDITANSAAEAREAALCEFWRAPNTFAAEIPTMDEANRRHAERLLNGMRETHRKALDQGVSAHARKKG